MPKITLYEERELAAVAKKHRLGAGITKAQAAREMQVSRPTMQQAEEYPKSSLTRLRIRMIESYSKHRVVGPVYFLKPR